MRVNGFGLVMIAAAAVAVVLGGCASAPKMRSVVAHQTTMTSPLHAAASTPGPRSPQSYSFVAVLRRMGHAIVSGVSWLFRVPSGVYGPPEKVAYTSARTWKNAAGTTGCTIRCDRVQRNAVNPPN